MPEPEPVSSGEQIGPYRVEEILGVGGMGYVYRAVGPDGEEVALKVVKPELARDRTFRKRFEREARIAQTVVHRHVVPVLATGEHEGSPFMAQRLVAGGTLADRIVAEGRLDPAAMVRLCRQVAAGLDALHQAGLIHRDVKPQNVLLDVEGGAHITDFGLAKDTQGTVLTRPGQALGSIDYMAPEQIRGGEVSPATDVYALGCIAWECLSGRPPFADREGMRILWAHLQDAPPEEGLREEGVPPGVREAVLKALEKDPAQRPRSASLFARMLEFGSGEIG